MILQPDKAMMRWPLWVGIALSVSALEVRAFECPEFALSESPTAPPRYAESLLWEIRGTEAPASYLFGTMHLAAEKTAQPTPAVTAALMGSKQFGMEVVMNYDALMQISELMRTSDQTTLSSVIGAELFSRAAKLMSGYGVDAAATERLKPWAVYTTLSLPPGPFSPPLDMVLLGTAQHTNKAIFGLETLTEQTGMFDSIGLRDQIALLTEAICHYAELHTLTDTLIKHYRERDLSRLYRDAQRTSSKAQAALNRVLLEARNQRMADRMLPYLEHGDAFIAIGALHLPGPDGVLARLVAHGYQVRPLPDH